MHRFRSMQDGWRALQIGVIMIEPIKLDNKMNIMMEGRKIHKKMLKKKNRLRIVTYDQSILITRNRAPDGDLNKETDCKLNADSPSATGN